MVGGEPGEKGRATRETYASNRRSYLGRRSNFVVTVEFGDTLVVSACTLLFSHLDWIKIKMESNLDELCYHRRLLSCQWLRHHLRDGPLGDESVLEATRVGKEKWLTAEGNTKQV